MVFKGQLTGFTVDEDQNGPPSQVAQWTDDLFIQSDNEVTPMTDIEDSSGDEVYDEEYLRMHMKSVHDEGKSSHDVQQLSIPRKTNQIKNAMRQNTHSPSFENTTGRHSYSRNEEEELDDLKRNLVHTRDGIIHGNSVNSPRSRLDPDEKVKTKAIPSDLEQSSTGHEDSVRDARPSVSGADIQTRHGQATVYKYDGNFRSDSICQDHIKKENHSQDTFKTIPSDLEQISTGREDSVTDARPSVSGADIQTRHGQATVYKYDGNFRSDNICQDHIKKESRSQDTFQTAAYEDILMKHQSEDTDSERTGTGSFPSGDVLATTSRYGEEMDCNIQIKKEEVSAVVPDHNIDTAMDKEETESGKRIDSKMFSFHVERNVHTHCGAFGAADGINSDGADDDGGDGGVDDCGDGAGDGNGHLEPHKPGNSGILIKTEVCDSIEDSVSVLSQHGLSVSSMDGCNSDVCTEKESCVNMAKNLPFPARLDRPCGHTENYKVQENLSLDTSSKSVAPDVRTEPPATNPSTDPNVHLQQKAPGKGISQQQSSPRHKKHKKKKRGPKPKLGKDCTICKKRFPSSELKQHMQKSHRHSCKICRKTIKDLVMFQGHMREHAGEPTPYWCDQCDKRFDRFATLDKHRRVHSLKGRWECSKCGKVITRRDYYLRHLKIHEDSNLNKCEVCGRQYASAINLRKHMVVHLEEKPIECPVCEKRFNFKSTLDYHMRSHTAATVKSATCEICGMECIHKSSLAIHMNIHTGMKPHVCVYCGKRFAQLSTKIGHEMNHENPNKKSLDKESEEQRTKNMLESFDCDECLMSFISLELLNGHMMKTHDTSPKEIPDSEVTPECIKPYSCGICEMPFLSVGGLRKHRIKKHPEHIGVGKGRYSSLGKNLNSNVKTLADKTVSTEKKGAATRSTKNPKKGSKEVNVRLGRSSTKGNKLCDTETADHPTSDSEPDPADDLPTSKQKPLPKKDLPKSKQGSIDGESDSNIDKNKCNICGKLVLELRNHMKYHSEKAYVCRVCGMRFAISANLKRHLRQHTGETPFQCKICGQRFMKAEALKKHKARHEGKELEKKYECSICGKKFLDNYHLKRHSVVHNSWPKVRDTDPANGDK